jgi:glycosyltransferase involved in cell wall biosynthesis
MVQRADVDRYPPVLHQMRELSELSSVTVVDRASDDSETPGASVTGVIRRRIASPRGLGLVRNLKEAVAFSRELGMQIARKPAVAFGYDPDAAALLLHSKGGKRELKRIIHLHELPEPSSGGWLTRLAIRYLTANLKRADLVIIPDVERARIVANRCDLMKDPLVVMNCPPLLATVPQSRLLPFLAERGLRGSRVVHYQGAVGPDHYLELVVQSMAAWPSDAVFVIVGGSKPEYKAQLRALAAAVGVENRVIFVGRVSYSDVISFAVGAAIGITLLEPTTDNWRFSAGASNKRFEYAALGIAQVTNAGPGMDAVFGKANIAVLLPLVDSHSIGAAVSSLLAHPARSAAMGERARAEHIRENNYQTQFAPVMSKVESWLNKRE